MEKMYVVRIFYRDIEIDRCTLYNESDLQYVLEHVGVSPKIEIEVYELGKKIEVEETEKEITHVEKVKYLKTKGS